MFTIGLKALPWIVLCFAFLNCILMGGKRRSFGIYVAQLRKDFNGTISLAVLNWIGDGQAALSYLLPTVFTALILKCGRSFRLYQLAGATLILLSCVTTSVSPSPYYLFLTYSALHGCGSAIILCIAGMIVNEYFDKSHPYHILATTSLSAGALGALIFVNIFAVTVDAFGWRQAFLILGFVYFGIITIGTPFFKKNVDFEYNEKPVDDKEVSLKEAIKSKLHVLLLFLWSCDRIFTYIVLFGMLMNMADFMRETSANLKEASVVLNMFSAGETVTYFFLLFFSALTKTLLKDRIRFVLLAATFFGSVSFFIWSFFMKHMAANMVMAFCIGVGLGPSIIFQFPGGEELTCLPGHIAYSFSLALNGVGMLVSPVLSGLIAELLSYRCFFISLCLVMLTKCIFLSLACLIICRLHQEIQSKKAIENSENNEKESEKVNLEN